MKASHPTRRSVLQFLAAIPGASSTFHSNIAVTPASEWWFTPTTLTTLFCDLRARGITKYTTLDGHPCYAHARVSWNLPWLT